MTPLSIFSALLIFCTSLTAQSFERPSGYWSTTTQENSQAFFTALTPKNSQRENWYSLTPYCAELWCTASNAGFFYVGYKYKRPELILAGIASALSHAVPKKWLHTLDLMAVGLVVLGAAQDYKKIVEKPYLLAYAATAFGINLLDTYLARTKQWTLPHIAWHLSAAYLAHCFYRA